LDKIKVVVIGGGTGTVSILNGLKQYHDLDISVIVSMTDDGVSNKVVRDEFGLLPLSDLRKSIIALARGGNGILRELFAYRFDKGVGLSGHTLGNLIMIALTELTGSELRAIDEACKIFNVQGKVCPVTLDDVRLVAEYSDGRVVEGEHLIDEPEILSPNLKIVNFYTNPKANASAETVKTIKEADFIVIGPGDLYTSTLANIVVGGVPEAIKQSNARIVFVTNLMTRQGQTHWMTGRDFVVELIKYLGSNPDLILVNNKEVPTGILQRYLESGERILEDNYDELGMNVLRDDLIGEREITRASGDKLFRSLIRHDSNKLASILYNYFSNN
jgi:uncharacterized cofD-like protein